MISYFFFSYNKYVARNISDLFSKSYIIINFRIKYVKHCMHELITCDYILRFYLKMAIIELHS